MKNIGFKLGALLLILFLVSCKKDAGIGGDSSIYGKVLVKDYDATFTVLQEIYYAQEQDVYIIYDGDKGVSDRVRTSYDGTYEFKYLREGTYKVFVYSKDSTLQTNAQIPIIQTVKITKHRQDVEVPELVIFN